MASIKPFSSPLHEVTALKKCHFVCILQNQHSATAKFTPFCIQVMHKRRCGAGCIFRGCVNCIEMCMTGSNKTILLITCNKEPQKVIERCLRASSAYMKLHIYNSWQLFIQVELPAEAAEWSREEQKDTPFHKGKLLTALKSLFASTSIHLRLISHSILVVFFPTTCIKSTQALLILAWPNTFHKKM